MKKDSRTVNSMRNSGIGLISQLLCTVINFVVRTVFIYTLNKEYLGINGLFTNILTILNFAELGIGNAIIYSMYKPVANDDKDKVRSLMYLYKKVYAIIGIVVLLLGLLVIPFIGIIIKTPPKIPENLIVIYLLYLIDTVFSYFYSYKKSLLVAYQKDYINNLYDLLMIAIKSIIQIIVLIVFKNYILYLLIYVISTLMTNVLISRKADKLYPYIKEKNIHKIDKSEVKNIFDNVKSLMLYKIGQTINNGTDNIIISAIVGVESVGLYSNYSLIIQAVKYAFYCALNGITGSVGNLNSFNDRKKQRTIFEQILLISIWIYGFASICLLILLKPFITIWIGNDYLLNASVVVVIVLVFYLNGTKFISEAYRDTCGLFKEGRIMPLIGAFINIILSIVLGKCMGLVGIFLATAISMILTTGWYTPYIIYKKVFKENVNKYYIKYISYTLVVIINYFICNYICDLINIGLIFGFVLKCITVIFISNVIFLIFFYKNKDFIKTKKKVINMLRRNKV